jgi:putative RecB family exonuclease
MNGPELAPTPSNTYSFSRVKCFHQCPLRYRWRYLEGRQEAFRSIESHLGSMVHDVLEWLYATRDGGQTPSEQTMLEEFAGRWRDALDDRVAIIRVGEDAGHFQRLGREMLSRFYQGAFSRDRSATIALEERLSVRVSDHLHFTGFADRIGRTQGGRLFVVDYKTSRSEGDSSEFSEGLQAPLYAACVLKNEDDRDALAGYHYLRHGTTRWQVVEAQRGEDLLRRFADLVREIEIASEFPARPSVLCAWCGFNAFCPAAEVPDSLSGGLRTAEALGRRLL